uniref:Uncharacterized protein n=1 Tax=Octopus bimaculoides TaxID=37653 RepID=A0A0L8G9S7_OCTBM
MDFLFRRKENKILLLDRVLTERRTWQSVRLQHETRVYGEGCWLCLGLPTLTYRGRALLIVIIVSPVKSEKTVFPWNILWHILGNNGCHFDPVRLKTKETWE